MLKPELASQIRARGRAAFLLSIIFHILLAIVYLFYPREYELIAKDQTVPVEWVKDVPKPELKRKERLKPPVELKMKSRILARKVENKLSKSSPNEIAEVIEKSKRVVYRNVEIQDAEEAKLTPWVMTDARIADAEGTKISKVISARGPIDGEGEITGRVRAKGRGNGLSIVDSYGTGTEDGMSGGGGTGMGIKDPLGMIDFLKEKSGQQQVVYCLDISASMSAAGLRKLDLAIEAIKDSLIMLDEDDQFNIVTFANTTGQMNKSMLYATVSNLEGAFKYLQQFTSAKTRDNLGTDLLSAIEAALQFNPSVIMLVTDGLPTPAPSASRRAREDRFKPEMIIHTVKTKNVNNASIYTIGLEMEFNRENKSLGARLLVSLANTNSGKFKIIDSSELIRYSN